MKPILLFTVAIVFSAIVKGQPQYNIPAGDLSSGVHTDPSPGYTTTIVNEQTWRRNIPPANVRYNHLNQVFEVNGYWLTRFNIGPTGVDYGEKSNNSDYFLYQGTNEIQGENGTIMFDTVYFNTGEGNRMDILNYNQGYYIIDPDFGGQPPGGIAITEKLYFNNGITTTLRSMPALNNFSVFQGAIVFINNASYEGGLSDAQHVDGFVSEINYVGSTQLPGHGGDFTFPVGNSSAVYQLRRQGTFNETDYTLTVGWVDGDPGATPDPTPSYYPFLYNPTTGGGILPPNIADVVKTGFWDWHFQSASVGPTPVHYDGMAMADPQTITVSIPDLTNHMGMQPGDLRLLGFAPDLFEWIDLSSSSGLPVPYASGITKGSTLKGIIPGGQVISALAIGSINNIILPATFTSFTVKADGCKALLEWQTGMEQNNSHFVVERSSNGYEFTAIARVGAAGNSNTTNTYKFTDEAPASGVNYYRITQVDFDGKYSSTDIKAIRIQCNGSQVALKAYPNPARSQVNIQSGKAIAQINVVAASGQTVMRYVPSQNQGGTFSLNIQHIQNGIYLLQVVNKDGTIDVIKLLKQ